jgi:hypothetical protein
MWWHWLVSRVQANWPHATERVSVLVRTKDGREFAPFSIVWRGATLVLCENDED